MRMKPVLEAADAAAILQAAKAEAERQSWPVSIAVVDESGSQLALLRLDGAHQKTPEVATEKARTAALFRRPTKLFQDMVKARPEMLSMPVLPVQGGVPIMVDGVCVGAVGVSGVQSHEDEQIAAAGVAAVK